MKQSIRPSTGHGQYTIVNSSQHVAVKMDQEAVEDY